MDCLDLVSEDVRGLVFCGDPPLGLEDGGDLFDFLGDPLTGDVGLDDLRVLSGVGDFLTRPPGSGVGDFLTRVGSGVEDFRVLPGSPPVLAP